MFRCWAVMVLAFVLCGMASAQTFNYAGYRAAELDDLLGLPRPKDGVTVFSPTALRVVATLSAYGTPCATGALKKFMLMSGISKDRIDGTPITTCIQVRSKKGKAASLFIQDAVAEALPKEVSLGSAVTLYVSKVFLASDGPGLLVNEFSAGDAAPAADAPASAPRQGKETADGPLRGEWRRAGETSFACVVAAPKSLDAPDPDALARACLRIGPVGIGDSETLLKATLGEPSRRLEQPGNASAYVYFLGKPDQFPYLVATVRSGRIIALQTTGPAAAKGTRFNRVDLGDGADKLKAEFGPAYKIGASELPGTDLWSYGVWPFSFEVKDGCVTSIRISDPAEKPDG
jgi:hypothetical protein